MHMTIIRRQLITQPRATEYETKSAHVRNCASQSSLAGMSHGYALQDVQTSSARYIIYLFVNLISSDLSHIVSTLGYNTLQHIVHYDNTAIDHSINIM